MGLWRSVARLSSRLWFFVRLAASFAVLFLARQVVARSGFSASGGGGGGSKAAVAAFCAASAGCVVFAGAGR